MKIMAKILESIKKNDSVKVATKPAFGFRTVPSDWVSEYVEYKGGKANEQITWPKY